VSENVLFFIGYGLLGILPLLQLKFLWTFLEAETIGSILAISTTAVVIAAFCDGAQSYRQSSGGAHTPQGRQSFIEIERIRLTRLLFVVPVILVAYKIAGKSFEFPLSICLLAASYCLNYSFVDRLAGSVRATLRDDTASRIHCQYLPAICALIEPHHGVLVGCGSSLALQIALAQTKFHLRLNEIRPNVQGAISADMASGVFGLVHASFCQIAASLMLPAQQFAQFGSIDRLVRASLLASEPARLLALRKSRNQTQRVTQMSMLLLSVSIACASCLVVALFFRARLEQILFSVHLVFRPYILVSLCITFASISTLCIFVRVGLFRQLNRLLLLAVLVGATAYLAIFRYGPFQASLAFELSAFAVIAIGSVAECLGDRRTAAG